MISINPEKNMIKFNTLSWSTHTLKHTQLKLRNQEELLWYDKMHLQLKKKPRAKMFLFNIVPEVLASTIIQEKKN